MIRREHFCNKLGELRYSFKRQADRVMLYKRPGDHNYVTVPRKDLLDEDYVRATLLRSGCSKEDVERFIANARCKPN